MEREYINGAHRASSEVDTDSIGDVESVSAKSTEDDTASEFSDVLRKASDQINSGPIDVVESVSEKSIEGKRVRNGYQEFYRVVTLDVKNAYNTADWEQIIAAIQAKQENKSDSSEYLEAADGIDGIEGQILNQTHWDAISGAITRQRNPKVATLVGAADDIALEVIKRHLIDVETASKTEIVLVQDWLNSIGLQLGEKKSDAVLKSRVKKIEQERVKEGNLLVRAKPEIGYLGLLLKTKLKFDHHLQYTDKYLPTKTKLGSTKTLSDMSALKKMYLVMNVSTAALLYPSSRPDHGLKLVVETNYDVEKKLLSGKNEAIEGEKPLDSEDVTDYVNVVLVDEHKRWKMRRTESVPDVAQLE